MQDLPDLALIVSDFEADQVRHLSIAVLLDHVDAVVTRHERTQLIGERQRTQPEVAELDPFLTPELIA